MMRRWRRALAVGLLSAVTLTGVGCSFDKGDGASSSASGDASSSEVKIAGWGGTTWSQNFNLFSPTATAVTPGTAFFYEPLVRLDRTKAGEVLPFLAESWEFNEDGTELTFTLRDDATWSDGEPFTAKDVAFTWQLVIDGKTKAYYPFKEVSAIDDTHVKVVYDEPAFADLVSFAKRQIIPEHVWKDEDPATFTNPEPIGTGPLVLDSFSPQQLTLKMRDDYWGDTSTDVKTVKIMAMSADAAKDALKKGTIDYGTAGWENADEEYVSKDPEHFSYTFYPVGTSDGIVFNTMKAPYDDPAVRRALRDSIDLEAAAKAVNVGYSVPTKAGLDPSVYGDILASGQEAKLDVEAAKKDLADAGWEVVDGNLVKDGQSYTLQYDVYQPYTEWVLTAQILADQWKQNLGLTVGINQLADQPFSQLVESGDYGMMSSSPTQGLQITDIVTHFDSARVGTPGEKNDGNEMFFKNERLDEIGVKLGEFPPGSTDDEFKKLAVEAQEILAEEAPFIATATAGWKAELNSMRWTGWPVQGETTWVPNNTLPADAILTILNLKSS